MKLYINVVILLLFITSSIGFVLPYLISAKSTELVIGSIAYCIIIIPLVFLYGRAICKDVFNRITNIIKNGDKL